MRSPFAKLLFPLLLSVAQAQQGEFKVGTWNLEFLGAPGNFRDNLPLRTDPDYAAIGKKVRELGVCALAVQEVNDEATLLKVAAGAGSSWTAFLGTSGGWDDGKTAQRIGFLYDRAELELLYAEELLPLPREFEKLPIFHRVPVTACFQHKRTGCDFRLVTVHLKAGRKPDDEQKRKGESQALAAWLDGKLATANEDPDVILLGDFNSTYGTEPQRSFEHGKRMHYLLQNTPTPTIQHFPEPIDQIVVADACQEVERTSLFVGNDFGGLTKEAWRQTYSDHFPVTVTLRGSGDDDPTATFARGAAEARLPVGQRQATSPWPPAVGSRLRVRYAGEGHLTGKLLHPIPADAQGWLVVEGADGTVAAIPLQQVHLVEPVRD